MFPVISNISDVLPHIEGKDEFFVADKGDHLVINYKMMMPTTFPDGEDILRECRGIIFDKETGIIIRRPLHKFFNVNERESTREENLHWMADEYHVFEKLDGSMIAPYKSPTTSKLIWGTKMGDTDVAAQASKVVTDAEAELVWDCIDSGQTAIFEFCSPYNQIVVPYEEEGLYLLAIRDNVTGEYDEYRRLLALGEYYGVKVVKQSTVDGGALPKQLIESVANREGEEGIVFSSPCGYYKVKVKSEWYVRIHKALERIVHEKDVLEMILEEKLDDVIPFLSETLVKKIREYEVALWTKQRENIDELKERFEHFAEIAGSDRKIFATQAKTHPRSPILFKLYDGWLNDVYSREKVSQLVINYLKTLSTSTKIEQAREFLGAEWRTSNELL